MTTTKTQFEALTLEEQSAAFDSLAKTIHEGAWMIMGGNWTFGHASLAEKTLAYEQAKAVINIATVTDEDLFDKFYETILGLTAPLKRDNTNRNERYAKAKAEKAVQWFKFFDGGTIL